MTKKTVKNYAASAFHAVADKAEAIAGIGYFLGNAILLTKNGVDFNLETLTAVFFIGNAIVLSTLAKNNPAFFRLAGALTMAGSACFAASGYGQEGFVNQTISMLPSFAAGAMMTLRTSPKGEDIIDEDKKPAKYANIAAGGIQVPGRGFLIAAGFQRGDMGLVVSGVVWGIADLGLALSDTIVKDWSSSRMQNKPA